MSEDVKKPVNIIEFTVEHDGKQVDLEVRRPSQEQIEMGRQIHNKAFREAAVSGAILRAGIERVLKSQNLWTDAEEKQKQNLFAELNKREVQLKTGRIKKSEGKRIALEMKKLRVDLNKLQSINDSIDNFTAEAQAENARFNFYVRACTVYHDGRGTPFFKNEAEYTARIAEKATTTAANKLSTLLYNMDEDFMATWPENKFLIDHGYAKLVKGNVFFVNKSGDLVDDQGKRIDEEGFWLNDEGKRVDQNGNLITEKGEFIVDSQPFEDDEETYHAPSPAE